MSDVNELTQQDLDELHKLIDNLNQEKLDLQKQIEALKNGTGRKAQVLDLLRSTTKISIVQIAERLDISTKNVSSQLTYLRQDGHNICTDVNGLKFLVEE